jgi:Flp pilus assembly protein CpaB
MATIAAPRWTRLTGLGRLDGRMLLGAALVVASVAGGLLFWGSARETTSVLVAARDLPAGHVLTSSDIAVEQVRLDGNLSSLAISETELSQAVGRTTSGPVYAGEMVVWQDLAGGPAIGPDEVAMTVPVEADAVYAGLRPGDAVSLLATEEQRTAGSQTVTLLERTVVYDVSYEAAPVSIGRGSGNDDGRGLKNVTLVVPRAEAERVAHATVNGTLTLALLPPAEETGGTGSNGR